MCCAIAGFLSVQLCTVARGAWLGAWGGAMANYVYETLAVSQQDHIWFIALGR